MIPGERYANGSNSEEALFWIVVIGFIVFAWLLVREKNRLRLGNRQHSRCTMR
jgi:hypothetical protein